MTINLFKKQIQEEGKEQREWVEQISN